MDRFHEVNPALGRPRIKGASGLTTFGAIPQIEELTDVQAIAANTSYLHATVQDNGTLQKITTGFTQPPAGTARPVTVTPVGTATDIKAVSHTVVGKDIAGNPISSDTAAFTADTNATKATPLCFSWVDYILQPAHDGVGIGFQYGIGPAFGLKQFYGKSTLLVGATLNGAREGTLPTGSFSTTVLAANMVTLSSSLNGTPVAVFLLA